MRYKISMTNTESFQSIYSRRVKNIHFSTGNAVPAVVDLPTPPFPEATTMTCWTPAMGFFLGRPLAMCCFCLSCNVLLSTDLWENHTRCMVNTI